MPRTRLALARRTQNNERVVLTLTRVAAGRYEHGPFVVECHNFGGDDWRWHDSRDLSVGGEWRVTKRDATLDLQDYLNTHAGDTIMTTTISLKPQELALLIVSLENNISERETTDDPYDDEKALLARLVNEQRGETRIADVLTRLRIAYTPEDLRDASRYLRGRRLATEYDRLESWVRMIVDTMEQELRRV